ncbi:hypothetical protein D3C72_1126580 [compost metagenome]
MGLGPRARHACACRKRHCRRPCLVSPGWPARRVRHATGWPVSPLRRPGAGNPANAPATPHGPGAGQDRPGIPRSDGGDRRPAGHPGASGAYYDHHLRRTRRHPRRIRRRAPLHHRTERDRTRHRGSDHAAGHGGHALAQRLYEESADLRVPRAEAWRARQAGYGHQGRRLDRHAVRGQHARLHPVLLQPWPAVLAQSVRSAAGVAQLAWPSDR